MKFHIGDILSITTGRLVSPSHIDGVYKILNYMTEDNLFTHQLPRASKECEPFLLDEFPQLANVNASKVTPDNLEEWLQKQVDEFGEMFEVTPIPKRWHKKKNPITELQEMNRDKPIIVVKV